MAVFAVLPAVGPGLIWLPAALIHVDNVLRPVLVVRDTQMSDYLVLLATLGGLAIFDFSGFVIGPVIAASFLVVWEMFAQEHAEQP